MWVNLELWGEQDAAGLVAGVGFGDLKARFRYHLDTEYDHHLLLNHEDPWAQNMGPSDEEPVYLPGLHHCRDDPTTENLAKWIGAWGLDFTNGLVIAVKRVKVEVYETAVNFATWEWES
jgi:6-pyruvoyl-tetrahydropterin synthase